MCSTYWGWSFGINEIGLWVTSILVVLGSGYYYVLPCYLHLKAARLLKSQRFFEASFSLKQALKISPRDARILYALGETYRFLGRLEEALEALKCASELEREQMGIVIELARVLCELRRYDEALETINQVVHSEKYRVRAVLTRCFIELDCQLFDQAEADADWLIGLEDEEVDSQAYNLRGIARLMQGNHQSAQADFETSYLVNPGSVETRVCCAAAWYRRKMYDQTILLCNSIIEVDSSNFLAFYYRGLAREAKGQTKEGSDDMRRSNELKSVYVKDTIEMT